MPAEAFGGSAISVPSLTGEFGDPKRAAKQRATPVSFPNWNEALVTTAGSQAAMDNVQPSVFAFLLFCKAKRAGASITVAQDFIGERERQAGNRDEALRTLRLGVRCRRWQRRIWGKWIGSRI